MENMDFSGLIVMYVFVWIGYFFWIGLYSAIITAGILGWKKNKNHGFILILVSGVLRLLHHLPSIYYKGVFAVRRLPPEEYGKLMLNWSYIDTIVIPVASALLTIGLLFVVLRKPAKNTTGKNDLTSS